MKDIPLLQKAIKETHGCDSRYVESAPVTETFKGQIVWKGTVEVFALIEHPKAKHAYAWSYRDGDTIKSIAVLELPPVDSPRSAVKVAIAAKLRLQHSLHLHTQNGLNPRSLDRPNSPHK